jgi:hypothetical protein
MHTEVRVSGPIGPEWSDWFEGLAITSPSGEDTLLVGELPDQAALYGLLAKLRDLRIDLRSVQTREAEGQSAGPCRPGDCGCPGSSTGEK